MPNLANWFITISTRGVSEARSAIDAVGDSIRSREEQIKSLQRAATVAFASMTASAAGFVRAGLQGTVQGERMGQAWKQLSQQIAAVFLPVTDAVTRKVEGLTAWFRSLSGAQQDSIMKWSLIAMGALGVAMVLPKVVAAATAATTAIKAMTAATVASNNAFMANASRAGMVAAAWVAIARGITSGSEKDEKTVRERLANAEEAEAGAKMGGVGGAGYKVAKVARDTMGWVMGVETNAEKLREQLKAIQDMRGGRRDVSLSGGSYDSDPTAAFKRLQSAALKADGPEAESRKQTAYQKATLEEIRKMNEKLQRNHSMIANPNFAP